VDAKGRAVRLNDQDRSRWDRILIRRGIRALERAQTLDGTPGPYALQTAIAAACHATARIPGDTNWAAIVVRKAFTGAAKLTQNVREKELLLERSTACGGAGNQPGVKVR